MQRLLIATLLASVAIAPAYAKDKNRGALEAIQDSLGDKALDRYEDKIERLEGRLEGAGDEERQRIENIIESVTERYEAKWGELPEEPPPPPPEPTKETIWKDDFNREAGNLGNGWEGQLGKSGVDGEHLTVYSSAGQSSTATNAIDLKGLPAYTDLTVSYTVAFDPTRGDRQFNTYWSADGSDWTKASPIIDDAGVSSFTVQNNGFQGFGIRFETLNFTGVIIDDVTLTGALPADYSPALTQ
jgi:hypothetical protein